MYENFPTKSLKKCEMLKKNVNFEKNEKFVTHSAGNVTQNETFWGNFQTMCK